MGNVAETKKLFTLRGDGQSSIGRRADGDTACLVQKVGTMGLGTVYGGGPAHAATRDILG